MTFQCSEALLDSPDQFGDRTNGRRAETVAEMRLSQPARACDARVTRVGQTETRLHDVLSDDIVADKNEQLNLRPYIGRASAFYRLLRIFDCRKGKSCIFVLMLTCLIAIENLWNKTKETTFRSWF